MENGLNVARETLVPARLDRVGQVFLQYELAGMGLLSSLAGGTLSEQLEVSNQQWNQLRELLDVSDARIDKIHQTAKRLQEELGKELSDLERDINRRLIEQLDPSQKDKLAQLTGQSLDLEGGQIEIDSTTLSEHHHARAYARFIMRPFHSLPEILGTQR